MTFRNHAGFLAEGGQACLALIGCACLVWGILEPSLDSGGFSIGPVIPVIELFVTVFWTGVLVTWMGWRFKIYKPALVGGFVGGLLAFLGFLFLAFTALIFSGPP